MKPLLIKNNPALTENIYVKEVEVAFLNTPLHFHNDYEMVYMEESCGKRIIGDYVENFDDEDLIILGPNLPHVWYNEADYYKEESTKKVKAVVTYFKSNCLNEEFIDSFQSTNLKQLLHDLQRGIKVYGECKEIIIKKIKNLSNEKGLKRMISLLEILNALSELKEYQCLASKGYINSYNEWDVERMNKVYEYIMNNFNREIELNKAAELANMTPSSFCKYFKIRTQKTFSKFVNEVRIGYACKLLFNQDVNISDVCFDSGFNNLANFNRNFKKFTNKTPREYRKSIHGI